MSAKLLEDLINDYNDISVEARTSRNAGITGQISGLFSSGQHKDVKEKAEAAQVALRGMAGSPDLLARCRACPVRPFQITATCLLNSQV
jgi:hypothetical protein